MDKGCGRTKELRSFEGKILRKQWLINYLLFVERIPKVVDLMIREGNPFDYHVHLVRLNRCNPLPDLGGQLQYTRPLFRQLCELFSIRQFISCERERKKPTNLDGAFLRNNYIELQKNVNELPQHLEKISDILITPFDLIQN